MADRAALEPDEGLQSRRFLYLYTLAWAGGSISYVPFLTLLLPLQISDLAQGEGVNWLAYITFSGAIAASIANILFGWLSDVTRNRRGWIAAGVFLSAALLVNVSRVSDLLPLIAVVVLWQFSINMMLGPLSAWAGDCVPDHQKGLLGGLLAFAQPVGAMSGALITIPGLADPQERLWLVAALVALSILPVVIFGRPKAFPTLTKSSRTVSGEPSDASFDRREVRRMWISRLLVQIAEAALFAFLLFWLRSLDPEFSDNRTANVLALVLAAAVPVALLAGRWADRSERPFLPLAICSFVSASGLLWMGLAPGIDLAIGGYVVFGIASTVFLALHSAQTLRVLPKPERRGRDLGIFNLTNTVPSLIMPWLTLSLVPYFGFSGLFILLSVLALLAAILLLNLVRSE